MNFKLCACDLDGTTLNSKSQISKEDREALLSLKEKGIKLVVATGRSDLQIAQYLHELDIDMPTIVCNGGLIKYHKTNEILHVSFLEPEVAKRVCDFAISQNYDYLIYTPEVVFHSPGSERIQVFVKYNETAPDAFKVPIQCISDISEDELYKMTIKVLIHHDESIIPMLEEKINYDNKLTLVTSGKNLVDIMTHGTTKGSALTYIADKFGFKKEEVIAFGDSENDIPLLEAAGFAVAMGNGADETKAIADFVSKTNNECGVAYGIKTLIG